MQKTYKEKWTKKRGQAESELTGHTTEYYINGVPKRMSEYKDYLSQIIDEETFKILTNPLYFNKALDWKKRRSIALDICGELSTAEIIDQDEKLKGLETLLNDKSIDDLKAEMTARRRKLNEELKSIPYRIDELSRENIDDIDPVALTKDRTTLEGKLSDIKNSKGVDYEFQLRSVRGTINFLETELKRIEQEQSQELRDRLSKAYEARNQRDKELFEIHSSISKISRPIETLEDKKSRITENMNLLREEFKKLSQIVFDEESTICPTCKQTLPLEDIEALKNHFEQDKAIKLNNINSKGKELKAALEQIVTESKELHSSKEILDTEHRAASDKLNKIDEEIEVLQEKLNNINPSDNKEYQKIQFKLRDLRQEERNLMDLRGKQDNSGQIRELELQINDINKQFAKIDLIRDNEKRIQELKDRERELAQMVAETEKIEFLCDQYVITKSNLLEDKLNSKFRLVKFKLFDVQVNGVINETFVTTVDGVPFEDLNNAMRINAGLDIINTLTDYYNFNAPIFIDNRESVNEIVDVKSQVINLIVSKDKKLRVEV